MRYQALAIDLDGTLLHPDESVTPRSVAALKAAQSAGLRIIIATARWYQMAERVALEIGAREPIIACAGAQVRRPADHHDLLDLRVPQEFTRRLYPILDARRCIALAPLDETVLIKMDSPNAAQFPPEAILVSKLSDAAHAAAPRMVLIQGSEAIAHTAEHLAEEWKDRVRFVESFSSRRRSNLTLTAAGADKGAALAVACADIGVSTDEVIAFGDSEADIEMFRVAGAAVAMGQASERVKSFAQAVTLSNDQEGVARAVERLLARGVLESIAE